MKEEMNDIDAKFAETLIPVKAWKKRICGEMEEKHGIEQPDEDDLALYHP